MGRNGVTSMRVVLGEIVLHRLEEGASDGRRQLEGLADHLATMRSRLAPCARHHQLMRRVLPMVKAHLLRRASINESLLYAIWRFGQTVTCDRGSKVQDNCLNRLQTDDPCRMSPVCMFFFGVDFRCVF